jgi:DNA end-binding protein Ku
VPNQDIVKGFKVDTDTYVEVTNEQLENVAGDSTRTIEIESHQGHARPGQARRQS